MHVNDKTYCLHCRHNKLGTRHGYDRKGGRLRGGGKRGRYEGLGGLEAGQIKTSSQRE